MEDFDSIDGSQVYDVSAYLNAAIDQYNWVREFINSFDQISRVENALEALDYQTTNKNICEAKNKLQEAHDGLTLTLKHISSGPKDLGLGFFLDHKGAGRKKIEMLDSYLIKTLGCAFKHKETQKTDWTSLLKFLQGKSEYSAPQLMTKYQYVCDQLGLKGDDLSIKSKLKKRVSSWNRTSYGKACGYLIQPNLY